MARCIKKGYIYKGLKPVYWCPHDETALAEAEIEYQDDPCTTVYVKFPMHDDQGKLGQFDKSKLFFVIWTTTIWTLPGNLAIALHPDESYALVKAPNGEVYILAEALVEEGHGSRRHRRLRDRRHPPRLLLREHAGRSPLPAQDLPSGAG